MGPGGLVAPALLLVLLLPLPPALARPLDTPSMELAALTPAIVAALFLITLVLFLAGCVCCKRNRFKQFTDVIASDLPEMVGTEPAVQHGAVAWIPADAGPYNHDREFAMLGPAIPEPINTEHIDYAAIPHLQFYGPPDFDNNNPVFENNNGPISPQELQNIVNNNAQNYIISENENRNLNLPVIRPVESVFADDAEFLESYEESSPRFEDFASRIHANWLDHPGDNFPRNQLRYVQQLGRGWFGRIVEAEALNTVRAVEYGTNESRSSNTRVAVKILDEGESDVKKNLFLNECKIYRDARNTNVLQLLGYNLRQDPWVIFFEYCSLGDLKTFLITNKSTMASQGRREIPLKFQCEIASALAYLHTQDVIHPDVACHSCMVTDGLVAKLGDYGGAKHQHPSDFFEMFDRTLPLRWYAPERWMNANTKECNIWSFGVFLWETCNWGTLPYETLSNQQIITSVLVSNGIRLQEPYSNNDYGIYLYQIMLSCWHDNPIDRTTAIHALSLLQYIYSNHVSNINGERDDSVMENFDSRWLNFKPNSIPKVDNSYPIYSQATSDKDSNYHSSELDETLSKFDGESICPVESEGSTDVLDEFSDRTKSDSLTNLHGSLESIQEKSVLENDSCAVKNSNNLENKSEFICTNAGGLNVAPWLHDLPVTSQEDMSYIKTVSDVISDLDNMLSSEKTSSSESSHQTSPSRDISNSAILSSKHISADIIEHSSDINENNVDNGNRLNASGSTCVISDSLSDTSIENANIDSHNISITSQRVPEINEMKNSAPDLYPTLDFRLERLEDKVDEKNVYQIFQNNFITNSQDYDSLQDTSYIPNDVKNEKSDNLNDKGDFCRQCSSGSETDDEIWKRRIEMGTITEKIKLKSKSVTDFMVLTHIDMDFTESEETSFTSVDGKCNTATHDKSRKKYKFDSPKDSSLPVDEYLSFPRNCSFSINGRYDSISKPDFDVIKFKKSLRNITLRNLRPVKSMNDLSSVQNKSISLKDLLEFKKNLDPFLDGKSPISENDTEDSWETTKYLKITDDLILSTPQSLPEEIVKKQEIKVKLYDSQDFINNESINKITNITSTPNVGDQFEPSFKGDNISPLHSENSIDDPIAPETNETGKINFKLDQSSIDMTNSESNVLLGPFSDCTLDLYTGLKTTFKDNENIPNEEEALMFSTNFNDVPVDAKIKSNDFILEEGKSDISSAYFFNSPATAMKSMSEEEKPINYSLETWDRFLGSSFENVSTQNFDSIFPDVNDLSELSSSSDTHSKNVDEKIDSLNDDSSINRIEDVIPNNSNVGYDQNLPYYDFNNITSKLAIAENENNLNIEQSNTQNLETENMIDHILNNIQHINVNENVIALENRLDSTDEANNSYYIQNNTLLTNQPDADTNQGWFLHPKNKVELQNDESSKSEDNVPYIYNEHSIDSPNDNSNSEHSIDPESVEALRTELELKLPLAQLMGQCPPQMSREILPYIDRPDAALPSEKLDISIDSESVKALRTELELKLPLVQQFIHDNGSNDGIIESRSSDISGLNDTSNDNEYDNLSVEITVNPINDINCNGNTDEVPSKSNTDAQITRNEVLIHYKTYGVSLLSPIQEESWSEVSEIVKGRDFDRSDTSNSLSLGQLDSGIIPPELPIDNVPVSDSKANAGHPDDKLKDFSDDDTNDDSHGSNLTFVALDGFESTKLDRRTSLSIDSLNGIDEQIDMDVENVKNDVSMNDFSLPNVPVPELLSPFYDDLSNTKSTEEISQNLDNLLENISKTLENASKVGSVSSDCNFSVKCDEISENETFTESESGSKTYVIENKAEKHDDLTYVCPDKVFDIPDDMSNVSKISQPSFISDLDTSNITESQLKPSEKSISQILHTKTPSMDSWCSNDTLFNVEENFDDICSFNDFLESPDKVDDDDARSITPTNAEDKHPFSCVQTASLNTVIKQASIEMVMRCPENTENLDDISPIFTDADSEIQLDNISSPENLAMNEKIESPKMDVISNTTDSNSSGSIDGSGLLNPIEIKIDEIPDCSSSNQNCVESKCKDALQPLSGESSMASPMSTFVHSDTNLTSMAATSTPNDVSQVVNKKSSDMSVDSLDSADVLIDAQFEFLNNIVAPMSSLDEETSCYDFDNESPITEVDCEDNVINSKCNFSNEPSVINFVSIEDNAINHSNIHEFIESEKNSTNLSALNKNADPENIFNSPEELSYLDFKLSAEKRIQNMDSIGEINYSKTDNNESNSYGFYDHDNSALLEYMGQSGLNMDSFNKKIENYPLPRTPDNNGLNSYDDFTETLKNYQANLNQADSMNVFASGLSNIKFSGPECDSTNSMESSYIRNVKMMDDINMVPPECLKDWDSGSDESNANSSSSGEFTWKKGDTEESISLSASVYVPPQNTKGKHNFSGSRDYEAIAEESNSGSDSSGSDEEIEFTPSSWNYLAAPSKSALKSPDTSQSEHKKRVAFKKQKYPCVYEYPREVSDRDVESPQLIGASSYMDWQTYCTNDEFEPQYDKYSNVCSSTDNYYLPTDADDDFFITSSTTPFEPYNLLNSSSQFFPGQHLSLLDNEIDDDEPLPPVPSEILLVKPVDDLNNQNNIITTILTNSEPSDFITPDSGTEDVTPGSMIEYEFKDAANDNKDEVKDVDKTMTSISRQELKLNLVNKTKSLPNCGTLILPDKSSPCGSLTPSTPSPSASINSNSSGSTSPLHPSSILGGLRHTRDKLKLDLPPSPLARNSPNVLSGKSLNTEIKIFDFKTFESKNNDVSKNSIQDNNVEINNDKKPNDAKSVIIPNDKPVKDVPIVSSDDAIITKDVTDSAEIPSQNCSPSIESLNLDLTLQKAVVPINTDESHKKSILEAVKGEGTLLDSGDEDSGIGSSAYTTLERKIESVKLDNELITEINER